MKLKFLEELEDIIKKFDIKYEDICLIGSAVLTFEGIRENGDLDAVINPKIREKIINEHRDEIEILPWKTINIGDNIQFVYNKYSRIGISDEEIFNKDYTYRHDHFLVIKPELELAQKVRRGWEKDFIDLKNIGYHFFDHPDFDADLFQKLLNFSEDESNKSDASIVKNKERQINLYLEGEYIMPVGALLHRAYSEQGFSRYDIMTICYFLSGAQKTAASDALINKIADKRRFLLAEKNLREEKMRKTFKVVDIGENGEPNYGSIELCEAICQRDNYVKIQVNSDIDKKDYTLEWLNRNNTGLAAEIEKYKEKIFKEYGVYFCAIVWGAAANYSEKIEDRIKEEFHIVDKKHIEFNEENYCRFIRDIYEIDDIDEWKTALKTEWLKKYEHSVDVIIFEIPFPMFREKKRDGSYLSDVGARLKREIREKYQQYIPDYKKDVIIHIGDNHMHNAGMIEIVEKYGKK